MAARGQFSVWYQGRSAVPEVVIFSACRVLSQRQKCSGHTGDCAVDVTLLLQLGGSFNQQAVWLVLIGLCVAAVLSIVTSEG
mmetsp:Transcript_7232/g.16306  ORF Transcript_7232/g.16306 Transcript_7232/m.16306 type:complete len:82 (-) Transcript_7232:31-276(-)